MLLIGEYSRLEADSGKEISKLGRRRAAVAVGMAVSMDRVDEGGIGRESYHHAARWGQIPVYQSAQRGNRLVEMRVDAIEQHAVKPPLYGFDLKIYLKKLRSRHEALSFFFSYRKHSGGTIYCHYTSPGPYPSGHLGEQDTCAGAEIEHAHTLLYTHTRKHFGHFLRSGLSFRSVPVRSQSIEEVKTGHQKREK